MTSLRREKRRRNSRSTREGWGGHRKRGWILKSVSPNPSGYIIVLR